MCGITARIAALRKVFVKRGLGRIGGTPEKLAEHTSREIAKHAQIVKQANIKIDESA
jgi:hypothetical protein